MTKKEIIRTRYLNSYDENGDNLRFFDEKSKKLSNKFPEFYFNFTLFEYDRGGSYDITLNFMLANQEIEYTLFLYNNRIGAMMNFVEPNNENYVFDEKKKLEITIGEYKLLNEIFEYFLELTFEKSPEHRLLYITGVYSFAVTPEETLKDK